MSRVERDRAASPGPDEPYEHPDPITDAALDWFLRLQETPDDPAAQAALRQWLERDPRHAAAFAEVERLWQLPELAVASRRQAARLSAAGAGKRDNLCAFAGAGGWRAPSPRPRWC